MNAVLCDLLLAGLPAAMREPEAPPADAVRDDGLAALAATGDTEAFGELVSRHDRALYALCVHLLGVPEDARDAAQEAFIRAWHALPHYREQGKFRAWLWCIAVNLCRDRLRVSRRRGVLVSRWLQSAGEADGKSYPGPYEDMHWRGEMKKLARGLEAMPDKLRWPLVLTAVEGLPQAECAQVLGSSVRAVEGRVRRARAWLIAWWEKN